MKKSKIAAIMLILASIILISGMGIKKGFYSKIVSMYKSYIYCNG